MKDSYDFTPLEEALASAQSFAIVLPKNLNQDKAAAALSLFLSLQKSGKKVSIVCSQPMIVDFSSLVGVNKIKEKMTGGDFMASFDLDESIEKVRYNTEDKKFTLIIQSKEDYPAFSPEKIIYSYTGNAVEAVFVVGAASLENLDKVYFENKELFNKGKVINLDINPDNKQFGKINFVNSQMASYSEFIALLLASLKLPVDEDIAGNLLLGIRQATANFSLNKSTATTFEAIAFCLRSGGRKIQREVVVIEEKRAKQKKILTKKHGFSEKPSSDWLKPKIYKGNTRI